jgi:multiple sugar transport system ATP-binding protein
MSMADRILVLREGLVQQIAPPEDIYHRPANRFVATVVGSPPMNFIPVTAARANGAMHLRHPSFEVTADAGSVELSDGDACWLGVRPEDIHIDAAGEAGVATSVYVTEPLGGETVVDLQLDDRVVKALAPPTLALKQDQPVRARLDPRRLHVFNENGDALLSAAGADLFTVSVPSS